MPYGTHGWQVATVGVDIPGAARKAEGAAESGVGDAEVGLSQTVARTWAFCVYAACMSCWHRCQSTVLNASHGLYTQRTGFCKLNLCKTLRCTTQVRAYWSGIAELEDGD